MGDQRDEKKGGPVPVVSGPDNPFAEPKPTPPPPPPAEAQPVPRPAAPPVPPLIPDASVDPPEPPLLPPELPEPTPPPRPAEFTPEQMVRQKFETAGLEPEMSLEKRFERFETQGNVGDRPERAAGPADWARAGIELDDFHRRVAEREQQRQQQGPQPVAPPAPGMDQPPAGGPQAMGGGDFMAGQVVMVLQQILAVLNEIKAAEGGAKFTG